jgi:hypothetical protein
VPYKDEPLLDQTILFSEPFVRSLTERKREREREREILDRERERERTERERERPCFLVLFHVGDQYDVSMDIESGGSLRVHETSLLRPACASYERNIARRSKLYRNKELSKVFATF